MSLVSLLVGLEASGRTLHSLPDLLLLFCGKMLVTTNCYQSAGLPKGRDLKKKKKNLNWHHWTDFFVFVLTCQNLGLLGLVKEKKKNGRKQWTQNTGLDDQRQTGRTTARQQTRSVSECMWPVRARTAWTCFKDLCCCFVGRGG